VSNPVGIMPYLNAAYEAELESLDHHHQFLQTLDELDLLFRGLVTGKSYNKHPAAGFLAMNSHAAFLAAVCSALRGQSPPTFMILRGCVESALYAYLVGMEKADGDIWLRRSQDPETAKKKFTANRAIQKLGAHDQNLALMAKDTYQWMIEFGAHPNPRSVLDHIQVREQDADGYRPFSLIYIHSAGSGAALKCLTACIENACISIAILCHAMPGHPAKPATFERIWILFKEFQEQVAKAGPTPDKAS
jgi:hypothetical protein